METQCSVCGLEPGDVGSREPVCGTCHFIEGIADAGSANEECQNSYDATTAAWAKMRTMGLWIERLKSVAGDDAALSLRPDQEPGC